MKKLVLILIPIVIVIFLLVMERHRIVIALMTTGNSPNLLSPADEGKSVRWHDDYFIIKTLDPKTFVIGEPRYHQQNLNYLIVGSERAILFDAGSGYRDVNAVAETLTDKPITFIPSHFHYDHVGNGRSFNRVAIIDLPHIRSRAENGKLKLTWQEHLGSAEGYDLPTLKVDEWLIPNESIAIGGRELRVLYTPGHTDDSISLLDVKNGYLFTGDFLYEGPLFAFLPNSRMSDYLQGTETLLTSVPPQTRIYGAHRLGSPGVPELKLTDVQDLDKALRLIRKGDLAGDGIFPITYSVNRTMQLLVEPAWLQNWDRRYPGLQPKKH
jgi:hydroxyacylglutathione hydrolase